MRFSRSCHHFVALTCLSLSSFAVAAEEVDVLAEVAQLLASEGEMFDNFGYSVSLDGDRLAVGVLADNDNGNSSGSAYVFEREATGDWVQVSKLLALDGQSGDQLGRSVSLDGDRLAVGAYLDDDNGPSSGSAYILERDAGGTWGQVSKLLALDGQREDWFGRSVSPDGTRLAVGAESEDENGSNSGAVYDFERDTGGGWAQVTKLLALDGQANDRFGGSVSLDKDRLAVGAGESSDNGEGSGSAYLFERNADGTWVQSDKLLALEGEAGDEFGHAVSLDRDRLAIGVYLDDNNGSNSGSTYVFETVVVSPHLTMVGTCPGETQLTNTGTTPRSPFGTYGSPVEGLWDVENGPCKGVLLGLQDPVQLRYTNSDFDAEDTLVRTIPESFCGSSI